MDFTSEVNRLIIWMLIALSVVGVSATYWAITGQESILQREDNPRVVEAESAIRRGSIYDRANTLLAESVVTDAGRLSAYITAQRPAVLPAISVCDMGLADQRLPMTRY